MLLFWQAYVTKTMGWGKKDYKQNQKTEMEPKTHHVIILVHFCSHWLVALAIYRLLRYCLVKKKKKRKESRMLCLSKGKGRDESSSFHGT